jgi:hypothetical protein
MEDPYQHPSLHHYPVSSQYILDEEKTLPDLANPRNVAWMPNLEALVW